MLWKVIDGLIYTSFGGFAIYCAWAMRGLENPSLLTVAALFLFGILMVVFGIKSFCYGRIPH